MLSLIGAQLQAAGKTDCNVFGGRSSCKTLPGDSALSQQCPSEDRRVDCAFYDYAANEAVAPPSDNLTTTAKELGLPPCDACTTHLDALWCAQSAPKCGSFETSITGVIIPTLGKVADAIDAAKAKTQEEEATAAAVALAESLPELLKASSLTMPCRAMCQAVIDTCGCGRSRTFGSLIDEYLESVSADAADDGAAKPLPEGFEKALFAKVWDTPLCDLYADGTEEGFVGHCAVEAAPTAPCGWCTADPASGSGVAPDIAQQMMAKSLAASLFDWTGGKFGLLEHAHAAARGKGKGDGDGGKSDASPPPPQSHAEADKDESGNDKGERGVPATADDDYAGYGDDEEDGGGISTVLVALIVIAVAMSAGAALGIMYMRHRGLSLQLPFFRASDSASRGVYFAMQENELSDFAPLSADA